MVCIGGSGGGIGVQGATDCCGGDGYVLGVVLAGRDL